VKIFALVFRDARNPFTQSIGIVQSSGYVERTRRDEFYMLLAGHGRRTKFLFQGCEPHFAHLLGQKQS
jgi:hypothetical protein